MVNTLCMVNIQVNMELQLRTAGRQRVAGVLSMEHTDLHVLNMVGMQYNMRGRTHDLSVVIFCFYYRVIGFTWVYLCSFRY